MVRAISWAAGWGLGAVLTASAAGGDGAVIADSVAEFSALQGGAGWQFGYYATGGDPGSFTELCCFDAAADHGGWWERAAAQPPWNLAWAGGQQAGAEPTARRWASEVSGLVRIDLTTDHWPGLTAAKTVTVLNDGAPVYERVLPDGAGGPVTDSIFTVVSLDAPIDFVVSAGGGGGGGAGGDPAAAGAVLEAVIHRLAVFPPPVTGPAVLEATADPDACVSDFVPPGPQVAGSCAAGAIVVMADRSDGLSLDDPYPVGITRVDWTVDELDCPNDPVAFSQWVLIRAPGCPDCAAPCPVHNVTQDAHYLTIQGALDAAAPGDEIAVGPGTYHETIDLLGKPVTLHSVGGPAVTAIDAQGVAAPAVRCAGGEGPATVLEGLTITGAAPAGNGGGMLIDGAGPTVTGCVFRDNLSGGDGAGIAVTGGGSASVQRCTFTGNAAQRHGGAIFSSESSLGVSACFFAGNSALRGAGLYLVGGVEGRVLDSVFSGNAAAEGGALWIGVFDFDAEVSVVNCSFAANTAQLASGIWMASACEADVEVANCVLWNQVVFEPCPERCYGFNNGVFACGFGNVVADPQFTDTDGPDGAPGTADDDLRLGPGSPCLDAGHNWAIASWSQVDLDGAPRFADDPAADTGCGLPAVVDMGAYERPGAAFDVAYGDIDGDGQVGIGDFLAVLGGWGACADACCLADLDRDGFVGITDFLTVIGRWTIPSSPG